MAELKTPVELKEASLWYSDILLHTVSDLDALDSEINESKSPAAQFLAECLHQVTVSQDIIVRFLFPLENGYILRNDFLERRLQCCEPAAKVRGFTSPLQQIHAISPQQLTTSNLVSTLSQAMGGIIVQTASTATDLEIQLRNRLSFPWLSADPIARKRICWVQGRENFQSIRRAYETAFALGITLVVFDGPGHWLQPDSGPYAHLREAFVECSCEVDDDFVQRVVDGVRNYPHKVDGVLSISDLRLAPIAKACEILGLPTSPSAAYAIAGNKASTRALEPSVSETISLNHADELSAYLETEPSLRFPLIIKPVLGWNSDCVARVQSIEELKSAVRNASKRHAESAKKSTGIILEPYISGPEVDANFALLDGEILFHDINDDFPSIGDAKTGGNFQETQNVFPSSLPENEQIALRDSLRESILRQGFTSGVFHCEARVRNSNYEYVHGDDGLQDLAPKSTAHSNNIEVYLLENNPRPPGYLETVAVDLTYGVDYYALRLLLSIGPEENFRIRALSQPYKNGAQFHLSAMIVPQTKAGVMKTPDAGADFLKNHTELAKQIPDYKTQILGGEVVGGPASPDLWWLAYFSVFSRKSRRDCLRLVKFIEDNYEYELE